jgi:plasmid stabilization system protein ParE
LFKVIVSRRAWEDFFAIFEFIAGDNHEAASRFCEALLNHTELLGTFSPYRGGFQAFSGSALGSPHTGEDLLQSG